MSVFKNQEELNAYSEWAKDQMQGMARHVKNSDLFQEEVVGRAVWTLPHRIFIGKVWPKSDRSQAYWIISGSDLPTDHIEARLAETARDAAKHFCMRWQLQGARLGDMDEPASGAQVKWGEVAEKLLAQAEGLYGLVEQDDVWLVTQEPLVAESH